MKNMKLVLMCFLLLNSLFVFAADKFAAPSPNADFIKFNNQAKSSEPLVNSDYIKSFVVGRVKHNIEKELENTKENTNNKTIISGENGEKNGNNLVNSVLFEPGTDINGTLNIYLISNGTNTTVITE